MQRVSVYIRHRSTRKYEATSTRYAYPMGTIFCLRYANRFETLPPNTSFTEARVAALHKQADLLTGVVVPPKPKKKNGTLTLDAAVNAYLQNLSAKSSATRAAYGLALKQFLKSCGDKALASVVKQDLTNFHHWLKAEGMSDRTIANRVSSVVIFLRHYSIKDVTVRVKYVEQKVSAYRPDQVEALLAASDPEERLLFQFFLSTGAREQEVMHAEKSDIDFVDGIFTVRAKEGWKPKDFEEREVTLPDFLLDALRDRPEGLLFPTADGKPNGHMLRILKRVVRRANLNGVWKLHKFRKTFATLQHRDGTDARTIQKRLGHSSLSTTLAYLEGEEARSARSRKQANGAFAMFA